MLYSYKDSITGSTIEYAEGASDAEIYSGGALPDECTSLFFPGCSMINYAMPLVEAVYNTLMERGSVNGISLLCCGRILMYEPNGKQLQKDFEEDMRSHLKRTSIKRIITACPNCLKTMRECLAQDEETQTIEVVALPVELARLGYRIERPSIARMVMGDENAPVLLCTHDSCPDRSFGEFAQGMRDLLPRNSYTDPLHCWRRSLCCGSLARAAGKDEAAQKLALTNGQEALDVSADAIVTACMSCAFQLNMAQPYVQVVHILELLYEWRINWSQASMWMKLRFLFEESQDPVEAAHGSGRSFKGIAFDGKTIEAEKADARVPRGSDATDEEVTISTDGTLAYGEEDDRQ